MMEIVDPPVKPQKVVAETRLLSTHPNHPNETFRTSFWVGVPYRVKSAWFCEEHVHGFPQRRVRGLSSVAALCGAIAMARIDFEGLCSFGWQLAIPEDREIIGNENVLQTVFGLTSAGHLDYRLSWD